MVVDGMQLMCSLAVGGCVAGAAYAGQGAYQTFVDFVERDLADRLRSLRGPTTHLRSWIQAWLAIAAAAFLILWLMYFGVRKRRYRSRLGTVQGWLSAHVYLGLGLITVVTLHTGFQFGWNVHTLAYVLMIVVIASGLAGVYCYLHFPKVLTDESGDSTVDGLIRQIEDIDRQALALAADIDQETHAKVIRSIRRNRLGGNAWQLLFRPPLRFVRDYVFKLGFLDGVIGVQMAMLNAFYTFMKQARLWELQHARSQATCERKLAAQHQSQRDEARRRAA